MLDQSSLAPRRLGKGGFPRRLLSTFAELSSVGSVIATDGDIFRLVSHGLPTAEQIAEAESSGETVFCLGNSAWAWRLGYIELPAALEEPTRAGPTASPGRISKVAEGARRRVCYVKHFQGRHRGISKYEMMSGIKHVAREFGDERPPSMRTVQRWLRKAELRAAPLTDLIRARTYFNEFNQRKGRPA